MFERIELFLFAPEGGKWAYTYTQRPDSIALLAVLFLVPALVLLWRRTQSHIETRPVLVLSLWLAASLPVQWSILSLTPFSPAAKVESVAANGFYTVSTQYSAWEFLSRFHNIAPTLPMHVQANLPGKVVFYQLLSSISDQPAVLAILIVLLSTAGGLLVYWLALEWFRDTRTAVVAAIFFWMFPGRIFFLPLLNTISPLFMLTPLILGAMWARTARHGYAFALGPALYALAIFDPLPLTAGLCGLVALTRTQHALTPRRLASFVGVAVGGLLATHAAIVGALGFDIISAYRFAIDNATAFNAAQQRPYWFWVGHNLKDFVLASGVAQSLAIAWFARRWLDSPGAAIGISIVACLLIVDLLGVNRAETPRLWIFLGVLFQILAARACAHDRRWVSAVIGLSIAQTVLCMRSIAWVVP